MHDRKEYVSINALRRRKLALAGDGLAVELLER
jgi:hypothetical protein